jgi:hypothetical protein
MWVPPQLVLNLLQIVVDAGFIWQVWRLTARHNAMVRILESRALLGDSELVKVRERSES